MWYVYILLSQKFKKSYVGCTNDVQRRIKQHNSGMSTYTSRYMPWTIIKVESYNTYNEARKRESFLKTGVGRKELKIIFKS
jgi:putative endonuclease